VEEGRTQMQSSKNQKGLFQTTSQKARTKVAAEPDIKNTNCEKTKARQDYGSEQTDYDKLWLWINK